MDLHGHPAWCSIASSRPLNFPDGRDLKVHPQHSIRDRAWTSRNKSKRAPVTFPHSSENLNVRGFQSPAVGSARSSRVDNASFNRGGHFVGPMTESSECSVLFQKLKRRVI